MNKRLRSAEFNFNFNSKTGLTLMCGHTLESDFDIAPFPLIFDFEITEKCSGPDGTPCNFCFPGNTDITLSDNSVKSIDTIVPGDNVKSFNESAHTFVDNIVKEIYSREYSGVLICLELDDGTILKLTPEHPVYAQNIGWVLAKEISNDMEIIRYWH